MNGGSFVAIGAFGTFAGLVGYGLWRDPVKPWLSYQCDVLRFRLDQRRIRKQHDLTPVPASQVCEELKWYREFFDSCDGMRPDLEAMFLSAYPVLKNWDEWWEATDVSNV